MPDNAWQAHTVYGQYGALLAHYRRCPKTLIGVNLLLRYREDGVRYALVPDVFVVFGVTNKKRPSYEIWEEGKAPDFVLEVASKGTYENDLGSKKNTYERMGVRGTACSTRRETCTGHACSCSGLREVSIGA